MSRTRELPFTALDVGLSSTEGHKQNSCLLCDLRPVINLSVL